MLKRNVVFPISIGFFFTSIEYPEKDIADNKIHMSPFENLSSKMLDIFPPLISTNIPLIERDRPIPLRLVIGSLNKCEAKRMVNTGAAAVIIDSLIASLERPAI